jgi:4-hydroxythreonine-4-phosphate dehydrogenase
MGINSNMLLLTDHIPLREVPGKLDPRLIFKKIELAISGFKNCHREIEKIVLLGINPHAGEHGSLGNEELTIYTKLFDLLSDSNPSLHKEIVPSDGFFLLNNFDSKTLIVSPYHDQGLSIFKALNGFAGTHLTFGLPFLRMSPIHGTAKKMSYNEFNPMGIVYTFLDALKLHN